MKWRLDVDSQLWKARDVKRNTIYDKSYKKPVEIVTMEPEVEVTMDKEPVENVTMEPEVEVTMEPEEKVTMPVKKKKKLKKKLTIRGVKKHLRQLNRTLGVLKKNKQEALLSKQFHSLGMK
ncbi:unnamed protein product [Polarella glacialis]|uniref:Uncharacterized protein n=1 Tax=Polarella glacialis TaxID=89957 RepID=A0A813HGC0_POLGL|nr:unnamed protein product [Polarella glacialis]